MDSTGSVTRTHRRLIHVLQKEQPQTIAVVLAQLIPEQAATIFDGLPEEKQPDVAYRMAKQQQISPQALQELENGLAAELKEMVSGPTRNVGGVSAVADMLGHVGPETESTILDRIDVINPEVAEDIRNRMVTFDSLASLTQTQVQAVLRVVDKQDLSFAMKGASEPTAEVVYAAISRRASAKLREEIEFLGRIRRSEVDDAQLRIAQIIRQMESSGEVTMIRGGDADKYVH